MKGLKLAGISLIMLVMVILVCQGCVTLQVKSDEAMNGITEIVARRVAVNVAKAEPDKVQYLKEKCDEILSVGIEESAPLLQEAARYAVNRYIGDPLLYDDIMSMFKLFGVTPDVPEINPDMGELRTLRNAVAVFRKALGE